MAPSPPMSPIARGRRNLFGPTEPAEPVVPKPTFPKKLEGPQPPNPNCPKGPANLFHEGAVEVGTCDQQLAAHSCVPAAFTNFLQLIAGHLPEETLSLLKKEQGRWALSAPRFAEEVQELAKKVGYDITKAKRVSLTSPSQLQPGTYLLSITDSIPGGVGSHAIVLQRSLDGNVVVSDSQSGWICDVTGQPEIVEAWFRGQQYPGDDECFPASGWFVPL